MKSELQALDMESEKLEKLPYPEPILVTSPRNYLEKVQVSTRHKIIIK